MVQIFSTFGSPSHARLASFFHAGLPQHSARLDQRRTFSVGGVYLPLPQIVGALVSAQPSGPLPPYQRTDFGKALEATREDAGAVALVGSIGIGLYACWASVGAGRACGCRHGDVLLHLSDVGASFALIAYVTVALGASAACSARWPPESSSGSLKRSPRCSFPSSSRSHLRVYLAVVFFRREPVRVE